MKIKLILRISIYCLTFLILTLTLFIFANKLDDNLHDQIIDTLDEVTTQSVKLVEKEIESQMNILMEISSSISNKEQFDAVEAQDYLKEIVSRHPFKIIGIAVEGGVVYANDDATINVGEREYYKQSMKGENYISNRLTDMVDNGQIVVFSVPVFDNEKKVIAVLFGTYAISTLDEIILTTSFDGNCYSYITTSSGEIIAESGKVKNADINSNILDMMLDVDTRNKKNQDQIKNDMLQSKSGLTTIYNNELKYVEYKPLSSNNQWYLMNFVPVSVMNNTRNYIMSMAYGISTVLISLSFFFIIYIALSDNKKQKKLVNVLYVDEVTGDDSFHLFCLKAKKILANSTEQYAFLTMDIQNFKLINEIYGYEKGNDTLCYIASIWRRWLSDGEIFCRRMADRYMALVKYSGKKILESKIKLFIDVIQNEHLEQKKGYVFQPRFGIYIINDNKEEFQSILNHSSIAYAEVKNNAGSYYGYYDDQNRDKILKVKNIEDDMRSAYRNKEFVVYYQPKYDASTEKVVGAEALVRWHKPDGTIVMPGEFIGIAENNGFIIDLDEYVFNHVCRQQKLWLESGISIVPISVNVSREHLKDDYFVQKYQTIRDKFELPDFCIQIEITESAMFDNKKEFETIANELHKAGFEILMDDFGTGYSSFTMLKDIPIDVMKLDKSFIKDYHTIKGSKIITSIMDLAKSLNILVTAEGVESKAQFEFLKQLHCDMVQGYYFAKPMRRADFEKMIRQDKKSV